jgi:Zn-dependent M28 family amino/carboxypeptidase
MDSIDIPAARISTQLAESLVAGSGRSLEQLAAAAEGAGGHGVMPIPGPVVEINASVQRRLTPARNVLAFVPGSDPELAAEVVIVCAHFDHDGANDQGVFNGADDDGSGTVALLEIAEAYALAAARGRGPRRSVLFAAWDAEESGLLGAWYYTEAPSLPLGSTVAVLNMDMIGRNEEVPEDGGRRFRGLEPQTAESNANAVNIMGYSHSSDLRAELEEANAAIGLELKFRYDNNVSNLLRRSDHWPFLQVGVPATFFHTGLHPDYHRFSDTPDRINYPKMERIARLVYLTSWRLANDDGRPALDRDL